MALSMVAADAGDKIVYSAPGDIAGGNMSFLMRLFVVGSGTRRVWYGRDGADSQGAGAILVNAGSGSHRVQLSWAASTGTLQRRTDYDVSTSQWLSVVITHDGTVTAANSHIYVDGSEGGYEATVNGTGSLVDVAGDWTWGHRVHVPDQFYDGYMAELEVLRRVVTADEIAAHAAGYPARSFGGLLPLLGPMLVRTVEDPISGLSGSGTGLDVVDHPRVRRRPRRH